MSRDPRPYYTPRPRSSDASARSWTTSRWCQQVNYRTLITGKTFLNHSQFLGTCWL